MNKQPATRSKEKPSPVKLFVILQAVLLACVAAAAIYAAGWHNKYAAASEKLLHGQRLAASIAQLQRDSSQNTTDMPDARLTELIEQNALEAHIRPQSIRLISPQPPVRIAQSRYGQKNTLVLLKEITAAQATELLYRLRYPQNSTATPTTETPLNTLSLRLTNPGEDTRAEVWNIEATISQTVLMEPTDNGNF